jgi:cysteine synthase B
MNPQAHYESTGPEIWEATAGRVTHLVAGIGTGGTIMGTGRYLKERHATVQVIAAEPDDALHGLEGLKHMASSIVPGIYHEEELDAKIAVPTDAAYELVYELSARCGLVVGQSSGAALYAARQVAAELDEGLIVMIFPDFGNRYLSTNLWAGWAEWRRRAHGV